MKEEVTNHFTEKIKDRVGISKKLSKFYFKEALEKGLHMTDVECRPSLKKYLDKKIKGNRLAVIYNRHIIIYSDYSNAAITILNLPKEFYSTVSSIYKEKEKCLNAK